MSLVYADWMRKSFGLANCLVCLYMLLIVVVDVVMMTMVGSEVNSSCRLWSRPMVGLSPIYSTISLCFRTRLSIVIFILTFIKNQIKRFHNLIKVYFENL